MGGFAVADPGQPRTGQNSDSKQKVNPFGLIIAHVAAFCGGVHTHNLRDQRGFLRDNSLCLHSPRPTRFLPRSRRPSLGPVRTCESLPSSQTSQPAYVQPQPLLLPDPAEQADLARVRPHVLLQLLGDMPRHQEVDPEETLHHALV